MLQTKIEFQQQKLEILKENIFDKQHTSKLNEIKKSKKTDRPLHPIENEKKSSNINEQELFKSITEQQKTAKDALNKLYFYQEEASKEKDNLRSYYHNFAKEKIHSTKESHQRDLKEMMDKLKNLEENFDISLQETEKLRNQNNELKITVQRLLEEKSVDREKILRLEGEMDQTVISKNDEISRCNETVRILETKLKSQSNKDTLLLEENMALQNQVKNLFLIKYFFYFFITSIR